MAVLQGKELEWAVTKALENFWFFTQCLMPPDYYDQVFHRRLCDFLQYSGNKKIVILARTHLKTTIASTFYPLWKATNIPDCRCLLVSNTSTNAGKTVHSIKDIVANNQMYSALFPERIPDFNKVRWSDECACLNRPVDHPDGSFESAGIGSTIIRRHFNVIIEDDTIAPKKDDMTGEESMPNRNDIEQAVGFHKLSPPLLIGEDYDEQLIVGTRWTDYDHIARVIEEDREEARTNKRHKSYEIFDVPAEDEDGNPAYKRFSRERLDSIRAGMGPYMYAALYMNRPLAKENMTFNPEFIQYYTEEELPEDGDTVITVDPADPPTGNKTQDYTAILGMKHCKKGRYVRKYDTGRYRDFEVIQKAFDMADELGATKIRIEIDKYAHLKYGFKQEAIKRGGHVVIDAVKTKGKNKEGRIRQRLQPLYENRIMYHKRGMRELEKQLITFPNSIHDDILDALAWQIERVQPIMPAKKEVKKEKRSNLPTVDDMLESLCRNKSGRRNYGFSKKRMVPSIFEVTKK